MTDAAEDLGRPNRSTVAGWAATLAKTASAAGPPLLFGVRMWASVCLALYVAFWLQLDNPFWAGTSATIVCQPQLGASLRKGWFRMIGTLVGATMCVALTACFPQDRVLFLGAMALWVAAAAFTATLLRNFAAYAAALAGYTVAIVGGDLLGLVGGVDANAAFMLAVTRASEICIGIACAGVVLALTDLGGARRRLAVLLAGLAAGISDGFAHTVEAASPEFPDSRPVRREFIRQVVALDPVIDVTLGESSQIRAHSPVLQRAVDGLFAALAGWRTVSDHLGRIPRDEALSEGAVIILQNLPKELRSVATGPEPRRWIADATDMRRTWRAAAHEFTDLQVGTPSLRLLADQTAKVLTGITDALDGLALLVAADARPVTSRRGVIGLRVPDWLPALNNAGRAFVTIGIVALFWDVTAWPGAPGALTFAAINVILLALRAEQAYAAAVIFTVGVILSVVLTAVVAFAAMPGLGLETFAGFSIVIGPCLVLIGALLGGARKPWQTGLFTAMSMTFIPLLHPSNQMTYNPLEYYNEALSIVAGCGAAALSFRLLPPLSPAFRTRRLLALTLRDLHRLAKGRRQGDWASHVNGRLSAMPDSATPVQRAQLLAALTAGSEIVRLRNLVPGLGVGAQLDAALGAFAEGDGASATARLARLDAALAVLADAAPGTQIVLGARSGVLALSEVLTQHAAYFQGGALG